MKASQFQVTAARAQLEHGLGDPVAIVYVYPGEVFVKGGDKDRDAAEVSQTLLLASGDELGRVKA